MTGLVLCSAGAPGAMLNGGRYGRGASKLSADDLSLTASLTARGYDVSAAVRLLWVICAVLIADAFAADPDRSKPEGQSPSAVAPLGAVAQSQTGSNPNTSAQPPVANKSGRKVLVDDTVTEAQLKQILAKGYRPATQAPGHEVSYCRSEQLSGERFQTKVCKTARRILEDEQRGKDLIDSVDRIGVQSGR